jgi:hypothetical protein
MPPALADRVPAPGAGHVSGLAGKSAANRTPGAVESRPSALSRTGQASWDGAPQSSPTVSVVDAVTEPTAPLCSASRAL